VYIREDMADIRVSIDTGAGLVPFGDSWATVEGGNLEADDAKTRPGGMGREISTGGPASRDDATVAIQLTDVTATWIPTLENLVGYGRMKIGVNWMNANRTLTGTGFTRQGTLKAVNSPDLDASGSEVAMLELVVSLDELGG
jgi:hypothetical protein